MSQPTPSERRPWIDRAAEYVNPRWGAERAYYRAAMRLVPRAEEFPEPDGRSFPRNYSREPEVRSADATASSGQVYSNSQQSRLDSGWPLSRSLKGVNSPLNRWRLIRLRDRARQLDRENPVFNGMLSRAAENVIGHGMRLRPTTDDKGFNEQVEALWNPWLDQADITGRCGAAELQRLLHRCQLRDGDIGINLVSRGSDAFLQVIEGDMIDTMSGGYDLANRVVNGIRFNEDNRAIAYKVLQVGVDGVQLQDTEIAARNFVFYARRHGFLEVRGEPCSAQTDRYFDQIDGYVEASVIAARIAACQALIIKKKDPGLPIKNMPTATGATGNQQRVQSMEPGMVRYINQDEDVVQVKPEQPVQQFPDFLATMLRFTGVNLGLPLELVFLDFSRVSYSSARASLLQAYRSFRSQQQIFVDRVYSRIYRWRVSKWVKDGTLKVPATLRGDPDRGIPPTWWRHEVVCPGWAWVDPVKEIQAAMMEVDAGFNSEENVCLQHGRTLEDVLKSKQKAREMSRQLQLELSRSNLTREMVVAPGSGLPPTNAEPPSPDDDEPAEGTPSQETPETDD